MLNTQYELARHTVHPHQTHASRYLFCSFHESGVLRSQRRLWITPKHKLSELGTMQYNARCCRCFSFLSRFVFRRHFIAEPEPNGKHYEFMSSSRSSSTILCQGLLIKTNTRRTVPICKHNAPSVVGSDARAVAVPPIGCRLCEQMISDDKIIYAPTICSGLSIEHFATLCVQMISWNIEHFDYIHEQWMRVAHCRTYTIDVSSAHPSNFGTQINISRTYSISVNGKFNPKCVHRYTG